jgi:hypothetical protein
MSKGVIQRRGRASQPRYSPAALCQSGHNHLPLVFRLLITHVRLISMTFTKSKVLIIGRCYSRNFTKVCNIKKLRDPFSIHAGALHTRTCCFLLLSFCFAGRVTRYSILGCM